MPSASMDGSSVQYLPFPIEIDQFAIANAGPSEDVESATHGEIQTATTQGIDELDFRKAANAPRVGGCYRGDITEKLYYFFGNPRLLAFHVCGMH